MIKAIIFDLGGVYFEDGTTAVIKGISAEYGIGKDKVDEAVSVKSRSGLLYKKGEMTGEKAEDVAYIDDNPDHAGTAKKTGMKAIHFKNPGQLETELKSLGVGL